MTARFRNYVILALVIASLAALLKVQGQPPLVTFAALAAVCILGLLLLDTTLRANAPAEEHFAEDGFLPNGFGRALIEKLPTALVVIGDRGRIAYANPAAERLLPHLRTGDHFANLFRNPKFVEAVNATLADATDRSTHFEIASSGRHLEAQVTYLPPGSVLATGGQVIVQFEDRTELRRGDEMRKDFIANASHELRTPLASIIGFIETIRGHARDDPEARERFLGIMEAQASRMHRLVEDLMSLSRIEMRAHMPPSDKVDVFQIAAEAVDALKPVAEKAGVRLSLELPGEGGRIVTGDRDELTQVVTNLVDNAIKYGAKGGIVRIAAAEPNDKYPRMSGITVADQGPGINRENIHRLTERFYRVNAAQSKDRGGTGLGLAIVKHVMARHGGALQITSSPGDGSRFTFWLPHATDAVEPALASQ